MWITTKLIEARDLSTLIGNVVGIARCIAVAAVRSFRSIVDLFVSLWFILFSSCSANQAVLYLNCETNTRQQNTILCWLECGFVPRGVLEEAIVYNQIHNGCVVMAVLVQVINCNSVCVPYCASVKEGKSSSKKVCHCSLQEMISWDRILMFLLQLQIKSS